MEATGIPPQLARFINTGPPRIRKKESGPIPVALTQSNAHVQGICTQLARHGEHLLEALESLDMRGNDIMVLWMHCCERDMKVFAALLTEGMESGIPLPRLQQMFKEFVAKKSPLPRD